MDVLKLEVKAQEGFDENTNEFVTIKATTLKLKHTLVSLKKWEQKYHIPFLDESTDKTVEQWVYYMKCMSLDEDVDPNVFKYMSPEDIQKVTEYIKDPMTATWISDASKNNRRSKKEIVTAEVIYYWMIELNVPIEFENWHLNQLLTLIQVINAKHDPKKMSRKDEAMQRAALNAQRRAKYHSKG